MSTIYAHFYAAANKRRWSSVIEARNERERRVKFRNRTGTSIPEGERPSTPQFAGMRLYVFPPAAVRCRWTIVPQGCAGSTVTLQPQ